MKKIIAVLFALCLVVLGGCFDANKQAKDDVCGTYRLEKLVWTDENGTESNRLTETDLEAYLVVDGTETGYLVYRFGEEDAVLVTVTMEYCRDGDNSYVFRQIKWKTEEAIPDQLFYRQETMTLDHDSRAQRLESDLPRYAIGDRVFRENAQIVQFRRISTVKTLDVVKKKFADAFPLSE